MTVSSARLVVLDASIAVKWYLLDEEHAQEAAVIFDRMSDGDIEVIVPSHFHAEVSNAVRNAVRGRRSTVDDARDALKNFRALMIPSIPLEEILINGLEYALRFDCAFYDALYLTLAEQIGCPFVHADRRLHNTLAGRFPHELWIEDYAT